MEQDNKPSRTQAKAQKDLEQSLQRALGNGDARIIFRWILDTCGTFDPSFTGNSTTFYNEGRRSVALELMGLMNAVDPYEVVRLMKEAADEVVEKRNKQRKTGHAD